MRNRFRIYLFAGVDKDLRSVKLFKDGFELGNSYDPDREVVYEVSGYLGNSVGYVDVTDYMDYARLIASLNTDVLPCKSYPKASKSEGSNFQTILNSCYNTGYDDCMELVYKEDLQSDEDHDPKRLIADFLGMVIDSNGYLDIYDNTLAECKVALEDYDFIYNRFVVMKASKKLMRCYGVSVYYTGNQINFKGSGGSIIQVVDNDKYSAFYVGLLKFIGSNVK